MFFSSNFSVTGYSPVPSKSHSTPTTEPTCQDIFDYIYYVDTTDENTYSFPNYVCHHFARDLIDNLRAHGIDAHMVVLFDGEECHAIVGIYCEGSLLLIEPQRDEDVFSYYDLNIVGKLSYYKENDQIWIDYNTGELHCFGDINNWYGEDGIIIIDMDWE